MDELVGEKVYETFGNQFPLLMKFIDASDDLSIQVHPDDEYALENEQSAGKTEMWYVLPSQGKGSIYLGWNQTMNASLIHAAIADGSLSKYLQHVDVKEGDVAFIPAGTVHAMQRDTIVAEIQENSDITYRLYDYNRVGNDGRMRPLKLDKALDVMNYSQTKETTASHPQPVVNGVVNLCKSPYFTTNLLTLNRSVQRDYAPLDSFVAFMCVGGEASLTALDCETEDRTVSLKIGEAVLIPAALNDIRIEPKGECKLIEIYID